MKICVAQMRSVSGDIESNIKKHERWIRLAASHQVDFILFPELSLSAYEPKLAKTLAMDMNDPRLEDFQKISDRFQICIGVGAPVVADEKPKIGMIIFQPHLPRQIYCKQSLHGDELPFFSAGDRQVFLNLKEFKFTPAICYESLLPEHSENAFRNGSTLYAASVAKSSRGVLKADEHFPKIANQFSMTVMMANCIGPSDDFIGAGNSSIWNDQGKLAGRLSDQEEGLLIYDLMTKKNFIVSGAELTSE